MAPPRKPHIANVHRIYTEDVDRQAIIRITAKLFDNFTLQPTTGFFQGHPEDSIVLEIVGARESQISGLAAAIGRINGQKSVLVIALTARSKKMTLRGRPSTKKEARK
jgi:hypothetical protein